MVLWTLGAPQWAPGVLARAELERRGGARAQGSHQRVLSAVSQRGPPTALGVRVEAGRPVRRLPWASGDRACTGWWPWRVSSSFGGDGTNSVIVV